MAKKDVDALREAQATQLNKGLEALGLNIRVEYVSHPGVGDRFVFHPGNDESTSYALPQLQAELKKANAPAGSAKAVWLDNLTDMVSSNTESGISKGFKKLVGGKKSVDNEAIIEGNVAGTADFQRLANSADNLGELEKVTWDLSASNISSYLDKKGTKEIQQSGYKNLVDITKALTNIAEMNGNNIQFRLDESGKIFCNSDTLSQNEMATQVKGLIKGILLKNTALTVNADTLNGDGQNILNALASVDNQIDPKAFTPDIVNQIENANILTALEANGHDDLSISGKDGNETYRHEKSEKAGGGVDGRAIKGVTRTPGLSTLPMMRGIRKNLDMISGISNQAKRLGNDIGGNSNTEVDPFEKGMKEADAIKKLPPMVVEEASAEFEFTPPAGGSKPAPAKGKGGKH